MESKTFVFDKEMTWEPAGEGAERYIMCYDDELMMVKVKFVQGCISAAHSHPHSQASYIASGKFEFTVDGVTREVCAGDSVMIMPNQVHYCHCIEAGVVIDTFSPMRKDFLK